VDQIHAVHEVGHQVQTAADGLLKSGRHGRRGGERRTLVADQQRQFPALDDDLDMHGTRAASIGVEEGIGEGFA